MINSSSSFLLDPAAVRLRASAIVGCKEIPIPFRHSESTVSFLLGLTDDNNQRTTADLARVSIFCDTGTISIGRIFCGAFRQVFLRHVSSLDTVQQLLQDPPMPTRIHHDLFHERTNHNDNNHNNNNIQTEIELADVGIAILEGEKEKLESHFQYIKAREKEMEQASAASTTTSPPTSPVASSPSQHASSSIAHDAAITPITTTATTGMEFQFSVPASLMKHVDQCLSDIAAMNKLVRHVALNGRAAMFLYGNGGVAYTPNIPKPLHQQLSQLRSSPMSSRPNYVSLATRDRYYCAFQNHTYAVKGPKSLEKELLAVAESHNKLPPQSVAFANTYDSYFVVFRDGSWSFNGRSIPEGLKLKLHQRNDKDDLVCVNLGPGGEWFLKAENGRMWWGGVSKETEYAIAELLECGKELITLDFGDEGSYFVSYD
jgi:hypothetical protein